VNKSKDLLCCFSQLMKWYLGFKPDPNKINSDTPVDGDKVSIIPGW